MRLTGPSKSIYRSCLALSALSSSILALVPPLDEAQLHQPYLESCLAQGTPLILQNCFPQLENEYFCAQLVSTLSNDLIEYDSRSSGKGTIDTYECKFSEFISALAENSNHDESIYFMSETALNPLSSQCSSSLNLRGEMHGANMFMHFPEQIRPKDALIIGGEGARSFLHKDPYEWTGWNYLLEGRKLCKNLKMPLRDISLCCTSMRECRLLHIACESCIATCAMSA